MLIPFSNLNSKFHLRDVKTPVNNLYVDPSVRTIIEEFERLNPLSISVRHIPHLRLDVPVFDLERALAETNRMYELDDFSQMNLSGLREDQGGTFYRGQGLHPNWGHRALINYTPYSTSTWGKDDRVESVLRYPEFQTRASKVKGRRLLLQDMEFYTTEIWDQLPYITSFITDNICSKENLMRTHLFRLRAGGILNFHNHRQLPWEHDAAPHDEAIIHIPLVTQDTSMMLVQIDDTETIDVEHYGTGECWLFNSWYNHAVDNSRCTVDRLHLAIMARFDDPIFVDLLGRSLESYRSLLKV